MTDSELQFLCDWRVESVVHTLEKAEGVKRLACMLAGLPGYELEPEPGAGHDYRPILEAVHRHYRRIPKREIDTYLYSALMLIAQIDNPVFRAVRSGLLHAQLDSQTSGDSPFTLELEDLIAIADGTAPQEEAPEEAEDETQG